MLKKIFERMTSKSQTKDGTKKGDHHVDPKGPKVFVIPETEEGKVALIKSTYRRIVAFQEKNMKGA